jgi:hypothetical protein
VALELADKFSQKCKTRGPFRDLHALKRLDNQTLRQTAPKGRKVLYVWDKAGINFMQWFKWKHTAGIYFISREKENMDLSENAQTVHPAAVKIYQMVAATTYL